MATARERLLQSLNAIISKNYTPDAKTLLKRLLNTYRVQAKPGEGISKDSTARDVLLNLIVKAWIEQETIDNKKLEELIAPFRMQLKQSLLKYKHEEEQSENEDIPNLTNSHTHSRRSKIAENISRHQNAYFRDKSKKNDNKDQHVSIGGGPLQKSSARGQCPKCRSKGIVLARSYGAEDYYSCIYCGYQAFLKTLDQKIDLPLAAMILDATLGDPEQD